MDRLMRFMPPAVLRCAMRSRRKGKYVSNKLILILMMLPGCIYFLVNNYIPMFGIVLAFKKFDYGKGIFRSSWNGFENFRYLFQTRDALITLRNTLLYNVTFIVLGTVLAIIVAIAMNEVGKRLIAKFIQPAIIMPYLLSWVVVAYIVYAFLNSRNGFINNVILGGEGISWYSESKYWPVILTVTYLWKFIGFNSIIYMAGIAGISENLYEAARIDGAGKLRQIWSITLPNILPTIIIMLLMAITKIFNSDFGLFYQIPMQSGLIYSTTQTIDTYVYHALMDLGNVGMSAAASFFQSVVGCLLVLAANYSIRKFNPENALF